MQRLARVTLLVVAPLLFCFRVPAALAQVPTPPPPPPSDEQVLTNAGLSPTAANLLEFFRRRAQPAGEPERLRVLVHQLSEKSPSARDRAAGQLAAWGPAAVPWLRQAANDLEEPEGAARARQCLGTIEGSSGVVLTTAALHVLTRLRPAGTVEVLLAYLPFAEDGRLQDEATDAVRTVALANGKADPALRLALQDPVPLRRRVAGELLARGAGAEGRAAVRPLLQDPKATVRLHIALALADANEADAVHALIGVLGELPEDQARTAEEALAQLAGEWAIKGPPGDDEPARKVRREVWAAWWRSVDSASLLDEFRQRCLPDDDVNRARTFLAQLADPSAETRQRAQAGLLALGPGVVPVLRRAAATADSKGATAAVERCLQAFTDRGLPATLPPAAARLLAVRRPKGAAEALLAYLPLADEAMATEIESALTVLARHDGKLEPALAAALGDKVPARRAAAAEVVCRGGPPEQRALVRPLLQDADPEVRLRAALSLAGAGEKEAVPVLIALLTDLPESEAQQAEEYLRQVAGDTAPEVWVGGHDAERRKCRDAWQAWWRDRGSRAELVGANGSIRLRGYTLIVEMYNPLRRGGRVFEVDTAGKIRWSIEGLQYPVDAQVLPGDHVLITEQNLQRVSERDLKGKVIWEKSVPNVLRAERLPRGQLMIVARNQLQVTDKAGKEVFTHLRPGYDLMHAERLRDGGFALLTSNWEYIRLDANGKPRKSVQVPPGNMSGMVHGVEVLPNDRLLVAEFQGNKVVEQDLNGKVLWEAAVSGAVAVSRLPSGHTLVSGHNPQRVCEVDHKGKVVWEYKDGVWPYGARRR
jgi:HEAT repeat protein